MLPNTIELTDENIESLGLYQVGETWYIPPKRPYKQFTCKGCGKNFIRYNGRLLYCSNKCSNPIINENVKLDINDIRKSFENEGYILLTTEYKNNMQKLDFICPNGHKHKITWANWSNSLLTQRCGKCAKNAPVTKEQIVELFENNGYTININEYDKISAFHTKLKCKCPDNHEWSVSYTAFKRGTRCPYCQKRNKILFKDIKQSFENEGYTVITKEEDYISQNESKIDFICPNGHKHNISVRKWRFGRRCGKCRVSKEEKEVRSFLDENNISYVSNDRKTLLNPNTNCYLELDIFFPDKKKAIELNGVYWHSRTDKINNDEIKKELCREYDINLMIITDDEWNTNKQNVQCNIRKFIHDV